MAEMRPPARRDRGARTRNTLNRRRRWAATAAGLTAAPCASGPTRPSPTTAALGGGPPRAAGRRRPGGRLKAWSASSDAPGCSRAPPSPCGSLRCSGCAGWAHLRLPPC
eukprot:7067115-Prymnesium_polylepis.2